MVAYASARGVRNDTDIEGAVDAILTDPNCRLECLGAARRFAETARHPADGLAVKLAIQIVTVDLLAVLNPRRSGSPTEIESLLDGVSNRITDRPAPPSLDVPLDGG